MRKLLAMFVPKFTITTKILYSISRIEVAKEFIENAPLIPRWEDQFREDAILRSVHHGTHVEGNSLDIAQVKEALLGGSIIARDRDIQEIINYRNVLKYIDDEFTDTHKPVDLGVILNTHKLIVNKVIDASHAGRFRDVQVVIRNSLTGHITYMPPTPDEVPDLMYQFIHWLNHSTNVDISPILKAGIAHYAINAIHPFIEGNGRTSRAVATTVLFKEGYDFKRFFSIEEYYDKDADRYYAHLQKVSGSGRTLLERDMTTWLEYFSEGLMIELEKIKIQVKKLSMDTRLKGKVGQIELNERQIKLFEFIEAHGQISNKEWRHLIPMVSDDTILRDLKFLIKKKLIRKSGSTKAAVYKSR